jgi:hypothetical protein
MFAACSPRGQRLLARLLHHGGHVPCHGLAFATMREKRPTTPATPTTPVSDLPGCFLLIRTNLENGVVSVVGVAGQVAPCGGYDASPMALEPKGVVE